MFRKVIFVFTLLAVVFLIAGGAYASDGVKHTVKRGEYLWLLGIHYGVPVQEIIHANQLANPDLIFPEQKIWIPMGNGQPSQQQISRGQERPSGADIELMARVVMAESRGEPYVGQVGVAAVLLNRLNDPRFPKTISGVIYQPGAFEPVDNGLLLRSYPSQQQFNAVRDAIDGYDPTGGALYFSTPSSSFIWTRKITAQIGNHIFAR